MPATLLFDAGATAARRSADHGSSTLVRMKTWIVVVVRAWPEADHLRVRMLREGPMGTPDVRVAGSAREAAHQLENWLNHLSDDGRPPSTSGDDDA